MESCSLTIAIPVEDFLIFIQYYLYFRDFKSKKRSSRDEYISCMHSFTITYYNKSSRFVTTIAAIVIIIMHRRTRANCTRISVMNVCACMLIHIIIPPPFVPRLYSCFQICVILRMSSCVCGWWEWWWGPKYKFLSKYLRIDYKSPLRPVPNKRLVKAFPIILILQLRSINTHTVCKEQRPNMCHDDKFSLFPYLNIAFPLTNVWQ